MRTTTWESIGTTTTEKTNKLPAEMCFEVRKEPVGFMNNGVFQQLPHHSTIVDEFGRAYGPVSNNYGLVNNQEALGFIENIDGLQVEKYGSLHTGVQYIIGSLGEMNVLGDKFTPYLIFRNSFNGSVPLQMAICPLRIVCQNQLNAAFKEAESTINIRHTAHAAERVTEAQRVMMATEKYLTTFNKEAERYAKMKISKSDLSWILGQLFPVTDDISQLQKDRVLDRAAKFQRAYNEDDLANFRGTAWHLIEAYADVVTHTEPSRKTKNGVENQFVAVTFDPRPFVNLTNLIQSRVAA